MRLGRLGGLLLALALPACGLTGSYRPGRVLGPGGHEVLVGVEFRFLDDGLPLPFPWGQYRAGLGKGLELTLGGQFLAVRAGLRYQLLGDQLSQVASTAEAGLSYGFFLNDKDGRNFLKRPPNPDLSDLLAPDAALAFGVRTFPGSEAYASLRYRLERANHQVGGSVGYSGGLSIFAARAELAGMWDLGLDELRLAPGLGLGLRTLPAQDPTP